MVQVIEKKLQKPPKGGIQRTSISNDWWQLTLLKSYIIFCFGAPPWKKIIQNKIVSLWSDEKQLRTSKLNIQYKYQLETRYGSLLRVGNYSRLACDNKPKKLWNLFNRLFKCSFTQFTLSDGGILKYALVLYFQRDELANSTIKDDE